MRAWAVVERLLVACLLCRGFSNGFVGFAPVHIAPTRDGSSERAPKNEPASRSVETKDDRVLVLIAPLIP